MEKTKKCEVVISRASADNGVYNRNWRSFPIVVSGKNIYQSFSVEGMALLTDDYLAHIEFRDAETDFLVATTRETGIWKNGMRISQNISQAFIKKFVETNGSIKEVLVEMEYDWQPKISSKGTVITHPVPTEMKIEDIPIEAIKNCLAYCENQSIYDKLGSYGDFYYHIKKWVDANHL